jgi:hypothetical protein
MYSCCNSQPSIVITNSHHHAAWLWPTVRCWRRRAAVLDSTDRFIFWKYSVGCVEITRNSFASSIRKYFGPVTSTWLPHSQDGAKVDVCLMSTLDDDRQLSRRRQPTMVLWPLVKLFQYLLRAGTNYIHTFIEMSAADMPEKVQLGSGRKKDTSLMLECFRGVTKHKEYWNKWIVDQCWIDAMMERCKLNESMQFAAKELNGAMAS